MRGAPFFVLALFACTEKSSPSLSPPPSASTKPAVVASVTPSASVSDAAPPPVVHGVCTIKVTKTTQRVKNLDATLTKLEPELRATYDRALAKNPSIAGTVFYDAIIDTDGSFGSVVGRGPDLPQVFVNDLTGVLRRTTLEPLARAVEIRGTIVCAPTK